MNVYRLFFNECVLTGFFMNEYCVHYECVLGSLWTCTSDVLYDCVLPVVFTNVYWLRSLWMCSDCALYECILCSLWMCTACALCECVLTVFFMNVYSVRYECVLCLWMCTALFMNVYCVLYECVLTETVKGIVEFPDVWRYFVTLCWRLNRLTRFCTVPHFLCPPRQWLDLRNDPRLSRSDPCHPIDPWTLLTFSVPLQTP